MTAGAILAGGRARRYGGADKCRLLVQGRSIIERQLDALRPVTDEIFVIVDSETRGRSFGDLAVPFHVDRRPGTGALGGIYTALASTHADLVITIACDLPFLPSGLLGRLAERAAQADGAWVRSANGPEPLVACYQRASMDVVGRQIDRGQLKAAGLAQVLTIVTLEGDEVEAFGPARHLLANINTPDEYAAIVGNHARQNAAILSQGSAPPETPDEAG